MGKGTAKLYGLGQHIAEIQKLIRYLPRTFRLIWSVAAIYLVVGGILNVVQGFIPPVQIWLNKLIVDGISSRFTTDAPQSSLKYLFVLVGLQLLLWILKEILVGIQRVAQTLTAERLAQHIKTMLAEKTAGMDFVYYDHAEFYNKLLNAGRFRGSSLLHILFDVVRNLLTTIAAIGLLIQIHPLASVVTILVLLPHALSRCYYVRENWSMRELQAPEIRMLEYLKRLLTERRYAQEIRTFNLKDHLLHLYDNVWSKFFNQNKKLIIARELASAFSGIFAALGTTGIYLYAIYQAIYSRLTPGELVLCFQAVMRVQECLLGIIYDLSVVYEEGLKQMHFYEFLDTETSSTMPKAPLRTVPSPLTQGIECEHVGFQYPGSSRWVLEDVNLTIRPGEKVALVGENGAGKTTLAKLIAGLYQATCGSIRIEGHDIAEYNREDLHRHFSVIFQDFSRYHLTARENIGFGSIEHIDDKERIATAARKAGADAVVNRLKAGYETYLGRQFGGATDLSGGEWQKIALSRAFMRDAQVLILDEPTASLDVRAEYEMYRDIGEITSGKIVLFISHRFSTVKMADRILVLENGIITEDGSHSELITKGGTYAKMYRLQAERYGM